MQSQSFIVQINIKIDRPWKNLFSKFNIQICYHCKSKQTRHQTSLEINHCSALFRLAWSRDRLSGLLDQLYLDLHDNLTIFRNTFGDFYFGPVVVVNVSLFTCYKLLFVRFMVHLVWNHRGNFITTKHRRIEIVAFREKWQPSKL